MPFPLSLRGTVFSELDDVEQTLAQVERALWAQKAKSVERRGPAALEFRGSFLNRRLGGSVLTVISRGKVEVSRSESLITVAYELKFFQNILVRGAVTALAFGFIFFGIKTGNSLGTFAAGFAFWLALASIDYMAAQWIFPRYLTSRLRKRDEAAS